MNEISIRTEIRALIDEKISAGIAIRADWVAAGVLENKNRISGEDKEFYLTCAYNDIRRMAKEVIGKFKVGGETPEQLILPGFRHLCKAYPMVRDEEVVLVPVDQCTTAELLARAAQLDEMADGCLAHSQEIRAHVTAKAEAA